MIQLLLHLTLSGSVDLTLTASPLLPCTDSHDNTMTLSFDALPQPQISILPNDTVCVNSVTKTLNKLNGMTVKNIDLNSGRINFINNGVDIDEIYNNINTHLCPPCKPNRINNLIQKDMNDPSLLERVIM